MKLTRLILVVVILALIGGGIFWYVRRSSAATVPLRTAPVKRGDLVATISATGTVEPEEVVDVGAQVAGQINSFGKDKAGRTIDYGSVIEEGMILAQIDDSLYASDVAQAQSQVAQARSAVVRAQADLGQMQAKLEQAQRDWDRAQKLGPSDALAQVDYDAYRSAYEVAKANVAVGEASIAQAQSAVLQAQAGLQRAQRNLSYTVIKSPVKGVIIDRRVNIGQTVVASLNAPSLFLIAKDLKRMQVWVSVNEADIGSIRAGQPVTFTVDAYPGQMFRGEVNKVRLNASMTQNVVTYTVEVTCDNSGDKLLPYLTANVQFEVARHEDVLTVPNAALRWLPQPEQIAPGSRDEQASAGGSVRGSTRGGGRSSTRRSESAEETRTGTLWVPEGDFVKPLRVRVGLSDGTNTEVQGKDLSDGVQVVIGEQRAQAAGAQSTNPFAPQFGGRGRGGGGR